MNRKFSILGVVVLMVVTVVATVAVAFAKQDEEGGNGQTKVILCHNKEKNNRHTITVAEPAVDAHVAHGDSVGPCPSDAKTPEPPDGTTLTLTTRATNPAQPGDPISDEATLEGASPNATGDITFKLYGPFTSPDPSTDTCVDSGEGANLVTTLGPIPIRAPVNGANGANGAYVVSSGAYDPDPPLAVGRYQWVASYSGDPNDPQNEPVVANYTSGDDSNVSVSTKCNDPNEQSVVNGTTPPPDGTTLTLTTRATNPATDPAQPGDPISDEATLEGASPNATGDITFKLYGPFTSPDPSTDTCVDSGEGANLVTTLGPIPIRAPVNGANGANGAYVVSSGAYDPDPPLAVGRYQWVASYTSGDDSNVSVSTKCNDPNEQSVVTEGSTSATEEITNGTDQNDKIAGGAGRDRISGFFGNDRVSGDQASDTLSGDDGADFVLGGFGRDRMSGGPGDDHMNGEDGKGGNDLIDGGEGTDHCVGDEGDTFRNCDGNIIEVTLPPDVSAPTEAGN